MAFENSCFDFKGVVNVLSFLSWHSAVSISDVTCCLNKEVLKCSQEGMQLVPLFKSKTINGLNREVMS